MNKNSDNRYVHYDQLSSLVVDLTISYLENGIDDNFIKLIKKALDDGILVPSKMAGINKLSFDKYILDDKDIDEKYIHRPIREYVERVIENSKGENIKNLGSINKEDVARDQIIENRKIENELTNELAKISIDSDITSNIITTNTILEDEIKGRGISKGNVGIFLDLLLKSAQIDYISPLSDEVLPSLIIDNQGVNQELYCEFAKDFFLYFKGRIKLNTDVFAYPFDLALELIKLKVLSTESLSFLALTIATDMVGKKRVEDIWWLAPNHHPKSYNNLELMLTNIMQDISIIDILKYSSLPDIFLDIANGYLLDKNMDVLLDKSSDDKSLSDYYINIDNNDIFDEQRVFKRNKIEEFRNFISQLNYGHWENSIIPYDYIISHSRGDEIDEMMRNFAPFLKRINHPEKYMPILYSYIKAKESKDDLLKEICKNKNNDLNYKDNINDNIKDNEDSEDRDGKTDQGKTDQGSGRKI